MEFLFSLLSGTMNSGEEDLLAAVLPLLKLLSMCLIGLLLAHRRIQIAPRATFRLLSKLVFALFLPCLIFTHLGPSVTLANMLRWWFIPVNILLSTAVGCLLGYIVALICRPPPEFFRFTVITTAFGNTGNLPLAVVSSVCHSKKSPFGESCYGVGVAYISYSQWASFVLVYTLVYHMMEPPLIPEQENEPEIEIEIEIEVAAAENDLSKPLLVEAEWPGMEEKETEHCKTPFIARLFNTISQPPEDQENKSIRCLALPEPKVVRQFRIVAEKTPIRNILQPPLIASLVAILIGATPQIKWIVYGSDAPLAFITDSLDIMAEAMVPCAMLVLGGMLAEGPTAKQSRLGIRTTIGIIVARLFVLPLIGIGVLFLADKLNFLVAGDKLFRFVLLLQYTTPSAILIAAIASLRGHAVKEASALLFWQHVFAVFSVSLYIIVYFKLLLPYV